MRMDRGRADIRCCVYGGGELDEGMMGRHGGVNVRGCAPALPLVVGEWIVVGSRQARRVARSAGGLSISPATRPPNSAISMHPPLFLLFPVR